MLNYVYKIKFEKSSIELNDDYERFSDIDKEKISTLNASSYFDFDNDGYNFYIITTPEEFNKYSEILRNNYIKFESYDLSNDILKNKHDFNKLKDNLNSFNSIKWDFFIEDINEWILNNLDIDTVLDRISDVGINNLSNIEKKFLNELNNN